MSGRGRALISVRCQRTGNGEQAIGHLTTATTLYHEMDMRF
jgi:hypothetical protein